MSIGHPCKYCTHGKMRPIQFSWDQAVILCNNKKCKSILYASPSECIIKNDLHCAKQPFSTFDLKDLLNDGSGSSSSSGVYSEPRSSLPSPALSRKSGTDEEVEWLLKASYSPLSFNDHIDFSSDSSDLISHTQVAPKVFTDHSNNSKYDGFFELLGNLDLELPTQSGNTESHSESSFAETGLDVVTTELEGWMKGFEFPSVGTDNLSITSNGCQQAPDEVSRGAGSGICHQLSDEVMGVEPFTTTELQGPWIPSQRSAFSLVDASNEESAAFNNDVHNSLLNSFSYQNSSSKTNETLECLIEKCENSCFPVPFTNDLMKENISTFHRRFMSPTASAASEDSGYNEEDGKTSSNSESVVGEENLKVSSKAFIHSSFKNADETSKFISVKQSQQSNFEKLLHDSLEWPIMSEVNTLTVLPAMVTTENNLTDSPQESSGLSSIIQTTSGESSTIPHNEREMMSFADGHIDGGLQTPTNSCETHERETVHLENHDISAIESPAASISENHEPGSMFSENHGHMLADESPAVNVPEVFGVCPVSQPSDYIVSEGSSHSTLSEPKNISGDGGDRAHSLDTSSETPLRSKEEKKKRVGQKRSRNKKLRSLSDFNVRKSDPSHNDCTATDSNVSSIRDCDSIKEKDVKRRKCKVSQFSYNEGGEQNLPLKKSSNRRQRKRSEMTPKVLPHSSRQEISSLENQQPTSSGENVPARNDALELPESDDKRDFTTTQNSGWQIPQKRSSRLCRRVTNLSPRKLVIDQVNRDPWSVADLYLEEVAIEIIVENKREVSCDPDKASKCDVQLQDLLNLFGKKQSVSEESHLSTSDTMQALPSDSCGEMPLDKEDGELPLKGRSIESYDIERKNVYKNVCENQSGNDEQNAKDLGQKEHVNIDKVEQKGVTTDLLHKLPSEQNSSQCDVIDQSHPTIKAQEDSQPLQKVASESENISSQIDSFLGENEGNSLAVQINSNSFFHEEGGFIKQQLVSNTFESAHLSSLEKDDNEQLISGCQETPLSVKQSFDKTQNETSSDSLTTENSGQNMEGCIIERTSSMLSNSDEKFAFESFDGKCSDGFSALDLLKTSEYESPAFEKVCKSERKKIFIENLNSCIPEINTCRNNDNLEACGTDTHPSTSPEARPCYFLSQPKFGPVRNWIGDISVTGTDFWSEEEIVRKSNPSKSGFSSSKYFQSLVEDMEVDESFLQCSIHEHPSETFLEHFKSSLFFGETASNSACHLEVPVVAESDFIDKERSESNNTSESFVQVCDQHLTSSVTSAAYTQVPLVPLSSNIAQVPITSVPINVSSSKVLSITGKKDLGEKILIMPNDLKIRHMLTLPSGSISLGGSELSSSIPKLPSESVVLQTSRAESSEGLHATGKKSGLTCEPIKYFPEWEIDSSNKPIDKKQDFALEFAGTSSLGNGRDQENLSYIKCIKCGRNSEKDSALSDSSHDGLDKQSRLDVMLKSKSESTSSSTSFTEILSSVSKPVSLVETSLCHCSAKVNEEYKTCYWNAENSETMPCKKQTECQEDSESESDSDDSIDAMPMLCLDSDDEILISIPETILEDGCTSQEGNESCTTEQNHMRERYLVDVPVDKCSVNDEDIMSAFDFSEIEEPELPLTKVVNVELKRKVDDDYEGQKKIKILDENQSSTFSNSQQSLHMCGILDNSVPHDEDCYSSLHQDFEDFAAHEIDKENTRHTRKAYAGSSKHCKSNYQSTGPAAYDIPESCITKESTDNDYSICSNGKETITYKAHDQTIINDDTRFGSVKASPQYESHSCLKVEMEPNNLDFFHFDSEFLGSLTENNASMPEPSEEGNHLRHCALAECDASLETKEQENSVMEASQQKELLSNEEILGSTSDNALLTNNDDNLEDKRNVVSPELSITSNDVISKNVDQFNTSSEEARPLFTSRNSEGDYNKYPGTSDALKLNHAFSKTIVLKSSQQPGKTIVLKSSQPSGKTIVLKSSQQPGKTIVLKSSQQPGKTIVLKSSQPSGKTVVLKSSQQPGKTIVLKSSQPSGKTIILKSSQQPGKTIVLKSSQPINKTIILQSPQPSGKTIVLRSSHPSPAVSSDHCDGSNKALCFTQSLPLPPVSCHGGVDPGNHNVSGGAVPQSLPALPLSHRSENMVLQPWAPSLFVQRDKTSSQMVGSGVEKQASLIDYQIPASANPPTIVPPALTSYYRDSLSIIAQSNHIDSTYTKGSMEKIIALSDHSSLCSVGGIVRGVASAPISLKEKNFESSTDYDNTQESSSMLKKVKLGSKGQFYLRPTPALKNAISEMRKKVNIEDKEEEETSSGFLTLPDGTPIPAPIFIPPKKVEEMQVIKQKKKRRMKKRIKRIQTLLKEKVRESLEFNNTNETPKVMVIYARGNIHICEIDVTEDR